MLVNIGRHRFRVFNNGMGGGLVLLQKKVGDLELREVMTVVIPPTITCAVHFQHVFELLLEALRLTTVHLVATSECASYAFAYSTFSPTRVHSVIVSDPSLAVVRREGLEVKQPV